MARPLYKNLTVQVLTAISLGIGVGFAFPDAGKALKPLGDGFISLVKMIVAPVVFLTIVVGIAKMRDLKQAGRVGLKAIGYFLTVTTVALAIGMLVANVFKPGAGVQPPPMSAAEKAEADKEVAKYAEAAKKQSLVDFVLHAIPKTFVGAFTEGEMLQVLLVALLTGVAVAGLGARADGLLTGMEHLSEVMFRIVGMLMKLAPLGAFGAMAYTIGKYGIGSLAALAALMLCVYLTMAAFVFVVLWGICRVAGFSLLRYLAFIREEILLVLGTSSSEAALPRMIEKLELMGCGRTVVGMVIPAGYSFNLDGTAIYLSLAALFIAQAMGVPLTFGEQAYMLGVLILTSKGAAAVTGGGFITLAATLGAVHPELVPGLALVLGVDRFMSEARAITNLIGNGVATLVVSKWEGEFDQAQYDRAIAGEALAGPPSGLSPVVRADVGRDGAA
jgi:aerobic C4-dicarboxylate transport protein